MNWRFYPLADFPACGVIVPARGAPCAAEFLTPQQAKALAERKAAQA